MATAREPPVCRVAATPYPAYKLSTAQAGEFPGSRRSALPGLPDSANSSPAKRSRKPGSSPGRGVPPYPGYRTVQTVARLSAAQAGEFPGSRRSALPGLPDSANSSPAKRSRKPGSSPGRGVPPYPGYRTVQTVARLSTAQAGEFPGSRRSALPGLPDSANSSPAKRSASRGVSRIAQTGNSA